MESPQHVLAGSHTKDGSERLESFLPKFCFACYAILKRPYRLKLLLNRIRQRLEEARPALMRTLRPA